MMFFVRVRLTLFVFAALLLLTPTASAQIDRWGYWNNGVTEPWWFAPDTFTQENADTAIARWNSIESEVRGLPVDHFAGDYFRGNSTHGVFIRWSPRNGYVLAQIDKCQAKVMGLSFGKVEYLFDKIIFIPEFGKMSGSHQSAHNLEVKKTAFIPVKWQGSLLLISESEMADFGDFVAGLGRYNYSDFAYFDDNVFFEKSSHSASPVTALPIVPSGYERFLKKAITAQITSVAPRIVRKGYSYSSPDGSIVTYEDSVSLTRVTLDAGSNHGLRPGMVLQLAAPNEGESVRVLRVFEDSSTGVIVRLLADGREGFYDHELEEERPYSKIIVGRKLTTSRFQ